MERKALDVDHVLDFTEETAHGVTGQVLIGIQDQ